MATSDYLAAGGDGYARLALSPFKYATGPVIADLLVAYFQAYSPVGGRLVGYLVRAPWYRISLLVRAPWYPTSLLVRAPWYCA